MAEEPKKISFGFSKSVKKTVLKSTVPQEQKRVDYIECLDEKSIKVIGVEEKKEDEPLVIPLRGSKTWHDRILNKTDADIFEPEQKPSENGEPVVVEVKKEPLEEPMEIDGEVIKIKEEVKYEEKETPKTLEEQAAKEILQDLQNSEATNSDKPNLYTLPLNESSSLAGEKESTLEDYENIPIDAYGMAMLRGMGWKPGKGIGKNEKLVEASIPSLRPKGMGLGADKVTMQKANGKPRTKEEEDLKLIKGAFVKMIAGKQKDTYGQIEGLDDDAGRFIVKMALGGNVISVNESVVQAVTKDDYIKNGKVLNSAKYHEYKNKDNAEGESQPQAIELSDSDVEDRGRSGKERSNTGGKKKVTKQRRHSSSDDNNPDPKSRKRKSSDSSEEEKKPKKSKKSKKHRSRDNSAERSSKKSRKKDKEREKRRDKKYSESPERRKHKKHKRSRSRSPRR